MTNFEPVLTLDDLDSLDNDEIVEGYCGWRPGDPEPGPNRGRAYWHGWMNAAYDHNAIPCRPGHAALVHAWLDRERNRQGN